MTFRLRKSAIAVLASSALILAGCADGAPNNNGGSSSSAQGGEAIEVNPAGDYNQLERDQIQDGGELTLPLSEMAEQQNTHHANGNLYTLNVWRMYNPELTLMDGDGTVHPNPAYLKDMKGETENGKTVVTYTLNPEAKFNDGTPIDWNVIKHTAEIASGKDDAYQLSSTDGYELIESVEKGEDDFQAIVTFESAYPWWEGLFRFLVPPQVQDPETFNNGYVNQVHPEWGAGPFVVDNVDFNKGEITFTRNDKWWGEPAKLDKFTYRAMESQASINAFRAGEVDATDVATKDRYAVAKEMGDQADIRTALLPANYLLTLNSEAPGLDDITVREAIMTAIDRAQIAAIRFNGLEYSEELPGSFALYQTQEGYEDNFGSVVTFDADKAKALLEEAGWSEGSNGIREKDGQPLTLRYVITGDSPMVQATATAIQKMLRDVGVDMQVEERPSSDFSKVTSERDFDIFAMGFRSSDPFGVAYFGQTYLSDSELNLSGTGTAELDEKIRELQKLPSAEEQITRANELEKEALATFGIMPYANGPQIVATKPDLANFGAYSFAVVPVEDIGWAK